MRSKIIILTLALLMAPGLTAAQMHGGEHPMMGGQGMSHNAMQNMDMMNGMMNEIHQMMGQGHWATAQQKQMQDMMNQMGTMKQQMSAPQSPQMEQQQRKQLQQMRQRLDTLKKKGGHQQH